MCFWKCLIEVSREHTQFSQPSRKNCTDALKKKGEIREGFLSVDTSGGPSTWLWVLLPKADKVAGYSEVC